MVRVRERTKSIVMTRPLYIGVLGICAIAFLLFSPAFFFVYQGDVFGLRLAAVDGFVQEAAGPAVFVEPTAQVSRGERVLYTNAYTGTSHAGTVDELVRSSGALQYRIDGFLVPATDAMWRVRYEVPYAGLLVQAVSNMWTRLLVLGVPFAAALAYTLSYLVMSVQSRPVVPARRVVHTTDLEYDMEELVRAQYTRPLPPAPTGIRAPATYASVVTELDSYAVPQARGRHYTHTGYESVTFA